MALGHLADQLGALAVLAVWAPVNPWNFCSSYLFEVSLVEEAYPGRPDQAVRIEAVNGLRLW